MIIRASAKFRKRFRCATSLHGAVSLDRLQCWSADIQRVYRAGDFALIVNEFTLMAAIIPLKGVRGYDGFLTRFLDQSGGLLRRHGGDPANLTITVVGRGDRSVIGTMNDMWYSTTILARADFEERGSIDWAAIEGHLHNTPYSAIGYRTPIHVLEETSQAQ